MAEPRRIAIEVAYAEPDRQIVLPLQVVPGTVAREAVRQSGLLTRIAGLELDSLSLGVFGVPVSPCTPLAHGDRVEIYRPLQVEPKQARRNRAARPRARTKD
jgi:uncharacterized protein